MAIQGYGDGGRMGSMNAESPGTVIEGQTTPAETDSAQTFKVCIECMPDGAYRVYAGDSDQDDAEGYGEQTFQGIDEALQEVQRLIDEHKGEGEMTPEGAQSYWNQLAAKGDAKRAMR
jgi:hypothetical protein